MKRELLRTSAFVRDLRAWLKSHPNTATAIDSTLEQLGVDAHAASLRTHKLRGKFSGSWASSAGYDLRIVFDFVEHQGEEAILLHSLGTHDEVY